MAQPPTQGDSGEENSLWSIGELGSDSLLVLLNSCLFSLYLYPLSAPFLNPLSSPSPPSLLSLSALGIFSLGGKEEGKMWLNHLLRGKRIASGEENSLWSIGELGNDSLLVLLNSCLFSLYLSAPFLNPLSSHSPPSLLSLSALGIFS